MRRFLGSALGLVLALGVAAPVLAQGTTGTIEGRVLDQQGLALPGATVTVKNVATGFRRSGVSDATGTYLFPGLPVATYDVSVELTGFAAQSQEERGQRAVHDLRRVPPQRRHHDGGAHRHRGVVAHRREVLGRGRGRDRHPDREPAAQRPAVRKPGRARSRREPGPPHRPHQVHPVRAAGGRGRRPQHQLPDRRRRQQRRHRRRPRAEFPARLHRRVQLRDPALPGGRGPRAGRGHQRGHQERNQRPPRVRVRLFPRRRPQLEDGDGEAQQRTEGWLPTLPVRREPGGAHGQGPDPLLRVLRAGQPGQHAVGEHSRALSGEGRRVRAALPREHVRGQGHPPGEPRQFPVRALRLQRQQPALRNDPELPARVVGHEQEQVPLRQHELQLRARRRKAERVHLPVLVLPQPHRRELDAAHRDLPERRERRAGGEHAADHRPAQVPVP